MNQKLLLTAKEVANLTGFSEGTIRHWVSQRRIPFVRVSARCCRFRRADITDWISSMIEPAKSLDGLGLLVQFEQNEQEKTSDN